MENPRIAEAARLMTAFCGAHRARPPTAPRSAICGPTPSRSATSSGWRGRRRGALPRTGAAPGRSRASHARPASRGRQPRRLAERPRRRSAERHPTRGGLRIGKALPERRPQRTLRRDARVGPRRPVLPLPHAVDARARQVARATVQPRLQRWAKRARRRRARAFSIRPAGRRGPRMAWKMSIDLERPLVPSMGHHDPLEGLVAVLELESTAAALGAGAGLDLRRAASRFGAMIEGTDLATTDPLGLGGLLMDAHRLDRLLRDDAAARTRILSVEQMRALRLRLLEAALSGLAGYVGESELERPASMRLAFRGSGSRSGWRRPSGWRRTRPAIAHCALAARRSRGRRRCWSGWRGSSARRSDRGLLARSGAPRRGDLARAPRHQRGDARDPARALGLPVVGILRESGSPRLYNAKPDASTSRSAHRRLPALRDHLARRPRLRGLPAHGRAGLEPRLRRRAATRFDETVLRKLAQDPWWVGVLAVSGTARRSGSSWRWSARCERRAGRFTPTTRRSSPSPPITDDRVSAAGSSKASIGWSSPSAAATSSCRRSTRDTRVRPPCSRLSTASRLGRREIPPSPIWSSATRSRSAGGDATVAELRPARAVERRCRAIDDLLSAEFEASFTLSESLSAQYLDPENQASGLFATTSASGRIALAGWNILPMASTSGACVRSVSCSCCRPGAAAARRSRRSCITWGSSSPSAAASP